MSFNNQSRNYTSTAYKIVMTDPDESRNAHFHTFNQSAFNLVWDLQSPYLLLVHPRRAIA